MRKSKRLQPVLMLAKLKEQQAAKQLQQQRDNLQLEKTKLDQLEQYSLEYRNGQITTGQRGTSTTQMVNYQLFLTQLDQAIAQQKQTVRLSEQVLQQRVDQWRVLFARRDKMDDFIDRTAREEDREMEKRIESELEDLYQRKR